MYEFSVNITSFDVKTGIQSCFSLNDSDLFSIDTTSFGVFFTTSNSNWQNIIKDILPFVEIKDVKQYTNLGVTHFVVSLKMKSVNSIINQYAHSLKKYCNTGVYVKDDKIIVNSDKSLIPDLHAIKLFDKDLQKFQNHVMICAGYISGEKIAEKKTVEHEAKLQEKGLTDVMPEKYGMYQGNLSDGGVVEYKTHEFGLDSIKIEKILLSNQFSDFIEHMEITKNALTIILRPEYFKLLYNYFNAYPIQKIVVVVNGKVYYMPSSFITNGMVSCRLVCSLDSSQEILKQCNSGFMRVSLIKESETNINHMEIVIILCILAIIIVLILIYLKKRRKALRTLTQVVLNGVFFSSADLSASLTIMPLLYILTYKSSLLIFPVIVGSYFVYMLANDLLINQWAWYVLCQSLLFVGCLIVLVLIPKFDKTDKINVDDSI